MAPSPSLAPLAGLYGAAVISRRWMYAVGLRAEVTPAVRTVSVGGLEAGGSGKTPVAAAICSAFVDAGRRPGWLSRGYGRRTRGLVFRPTGARADPNAIGDEPAMVVAGGLDLPVAACADRRRGAQRLIAAGCDVLILDDGFSHQSIGRHVDIVVLRGEAPFGSGHLLPWGELREPPSSLRRADVVWLHHKTGIAADGVPNAAPAWHAHLCPAADIVHSRAVPVGPWRLGDPVNSLPGALRGARVLAVAGIARPEDLRHSLDAVGAQRIALMPFRDHHHYTATDVARIASRAAGFDAVVTTAKDAVKLGALPGTGEWWVLGTAVEVIAAAGVLTRILGIP